MKRGEALEEKILENVKNRKEFLKMGKLGTIFTQFFPGFYHHFIFTEKEKEIPVVRGMEVVKFLFGKRMPINK